MRTRIAHVAALLSLALCATAGAAAPPLLPLQGVLTDADGVPLASAVSMRFSLHTAETDGTEVWYESQTITPVDGLFAAYLGQGTGATLSLATFRDQGELWLEVKVGTDPPMPRVRLGSVGYAGYAEYCGTVPAHTHPATDLPDGVVIGAQACGGSDKVRGVSATGAIVCAPDLGTGPDTLGQLSCTTGQTVKWNGSVWACAADDNSGGTITAVNAGDPLVSSLTGTAVTVGLQPCGADETLRYQSSQWQCSPGVQDVATPAAGGLALSKTNASYSLSLRTCATGEILKYDASTPGWLCTADANAGGDVTDVLATANGGLTVSNSAGPQPSLALIACSTTGQILKYTSGTGWACGADANSGGTVTSIATGAGLTGGPITGSGTIAASFAGTGGNFGAASTLARSDHAHSGTYLPLGATLGCSGTDKVVGLNTNGSVQCGADLNAGGDVTDVNATAGGGLTVTGPTGPAPSVGITPCANNETLRYSTSTGWGCVAYTGGDLTGVIATAGGGVTVGAGSGPVPSVGLTPCAVGETLQYQNGSGWSCVAYTGGDLTDVLATAGGGLTVTNPAGPQPAVGITPCGDGQTLAYQNGVGWTCVDYTVGDVTDVLVASNGGLAVTNSAGPQPQLSLVTCTDQQALRYTAGVGWECADPLLGVTGGTGLSGGGTSGNVTLTLDTAYTDGRYWQRTGNSGTDPAFDYVGTTDATPLELRVEDARALRLEPTTGAPNVIAGAPTNTVTAGVTGAAVGGGDANLIDASYATIPGGSGNHAGGQFAFAAGHGAAATADGCFVWADATVTAGMAAATCGTKNEFVARAYGGFRLITGDDGAGGAIGAWLPTGSGSWSILSDRNLKRDFGPVDPRAVLAKVATMPLSTWRYKAETSRARHLGPMAQDFHAAFGLGDSDRGIATVDADGVALAAIQGLHQVDGELRAENARLRAEVQRLEAQVTQLDGLAARVARLEQARPAGAGARDLGLGAFGVLVVGGLVVARRRQHR